MSAGLANTRNSSTGSSRIWVVDGRQFVAATTIPAAPPELARWLGDGERARLQRFLKPQRAREFLLGRLLLRHALRQVLGCTYDAITITERPGAAPQVMIGTRLADGMDLPGLSLSHSRGWLACALGDTFALGVDIEAPAPQRDLAALARVMFSAAEVRWLGQRADHDSAFYRLWCAKEAIYKHAHNAGFATSTGLPELACAAGEEQPFATRGFLRHDRCDEFHLSVFSATAPQEHAVERMSCPELLKSFAA